jgi:hypothetical protein
MSKSHALRRISQFAFAAAAFIAIGTAPGSAEWDPSAIHITPPDKIPWMDNGASATAILAGDPNKPGLYVELTKWHAGHNSRPHYHSTDRYITVMSGTWWVGTGTVLDHSIEKPMTPGSYVVHPAMGVHWDGARDADCVIEIVGMGPVSTVQAEKK